MEIDLKGITKKGEADYVIKLTIGASSWEEAVKIAETVEDELENVLTGQTKLSE